MINGIVIWGAGRHRRIDARRSRRRLEEPRLFLLDGVVLPRAAAAALAALMPKFKGPRPRQPKLDSLDREDSVL